MTVRERMKDWRERFGVTVGQMALRANCSTGLLIGVESGEVTHPNIAHRIGVAYGLTELETEELMPKNYRLHGGDYEPDRYVASPDRAPLCIPCGVPVGKEAYES